MFKKLTIISTIALLSLTGCDDAPSCSDKKVQDYLMSVAPNIMQGSELILQHPEITIHGITTVNHESDSYTCTAQITYDVKDKGQQHTVPITYTTSTSDDGKEFFVKVIKLY